MNRAYNRSELDYRSFVNKGNGRPEDDEQHKSLVAERKAYQAAHPKPWYLNESKIIKKYYGQQKSE